MHHCSAVCTAELFAKKLCNPRRVESGFASLLWRENPWENMTRQTFWQVMQLALGRYEFHLRILLEFSYWLMEKTMKKIEIRNKHLANNISKRSLSKKHTIKKNIHKLSTCYQIYFTLQQTIFRHFLCIHCFFHCYFWVSNSFGDGGQCQLQMSWPRCEVLEEESLIESIGGFLEDSERANTKSTGEGLGKHDMFFFFDMVVSTK